jgi:hypothetical protein
MFESEKLPDQLLSRARQQAFSGFFGILPAVFGNVCGIAAKPPAPPR